MSKRETLDLTIPVTEEHIRASQDENCWRCAVTLAVYDAWKTANLDDVDDLYRDFDPSLPYAVSTYTDHIALWVEAGATDLLLAVARYPKNSVPLHPKQPITLEVQFCLADDDKFPFIG